MLLFKQFNWGWWSVCLYLQNPRFTHQEQHQYFGKPKKSTSVKPYICWLLKAVQAKSIDLWSHGAGIFQANWRRRSYGGQAWLDQKTPGSAIAVLQLPDEFRPQKVHPLYDSTHQRHQVNRSRNHIRVVSHP